MTDHEIAEAGTVKDPLPVTTKRGLVKSTIPPELNEPLTVNIVVPPSATDEA